jgi:hypothetical protein
MSLDISQITRVYNGKLGACMCGCSGKYSTNPAYRDLVGQERGYPVADEECSERSVKIIARKVLSNLFSNYDGKMVVLEDPRAGHAGTIKVVWFK